MLNKIKATNRKEPKRQSLPLSSIALTLLFFQSFTLNAAATEVQEVVESYCKCMKPVYSKIKELQDVMVSEELDGLEDLHKELQALEPTLKECSETLEKKFAGQANQAELHDKIQKEISQRCPKPKMSPKR